MSLHPQRIPPVPDQTVEVAQAAFPKGNIYLRLRDELGVFYQDCDWENLYSKHGQPGYAPWRLAMVLVMQFLDNLSDRQAAEAVRGRIDWKYALSLDLRDPGFDFTILSEFRERLIKCEAEQKVLDQMLEKLAQKGLLLARGKQRTDSTHVLAKIRELTLLREYYRNSTLCFKYISPSGSRVAPELD